MKYFFCILTEVHSLGITKKTQTWPRAILPTGGSARRALRLPSPPRGFLPAVARVRPTTPSRPSFRTASRPLAPFFPHEIDLQDLSKDEIAAGTWTVRQMFNYLWYLRDFCNQKESEPSICIPRVFPNITRPASGPSSPASALASSTRSTWSPARTTAARPSTASSCTSSSGTRTLTTPTLMGPTMTS